jgi:pimeloyl-ACP methyl ester carboxylesterase
MVKGFERMRRLRRFAFFACFLCVVAAVTGYAYDRAATLHDKKKYPLKGKLIDVGGYRLHLYCVGQGSPTVLLDSGAFDSLEQWNTVQPKVAEFTRVCSYDRPGLGWSDPSPLPHTSVQIATELHEALNKAGLSGPYLPVGHSIAGLYARVFASHYRNEVAGLVLVDSVHPDEFKRFPSHVPNHPIPFAVLRVTAPLGAARLFHFGCRQTGAHPDCSKFVVNLIRQVETIPTSYAQANSSGSLGGLPLIVITHDPQVGLGKPKDEQEEDAWTRWQVELSHLSSHSSLLIANGAGHEIERDKPEVVANAIQRLIKEWRDQNESPVVEALRPELQPVRRD